MNKASILIVDDDLGMRETLEAVLVDDGLQVVSAASGQEALKRLETRTFHVVLLDLRMPDSNGLELLPRIKATAPETSVIIMTAYGTIKTAVEAVKLGAFDFITKPFELDEVRLVIERSLQLQQLSRENEQLRTMLADQFIFKDIVGGSEKMEQVFDIIRKVANHDVTILIQGESGTGKELVAEAIHYNSPRRDKPLIKLNCAALPETLLESELFGYEKGAFTGANTRKPGRFELAQGGTLFLDEISSTAPSMQAKLLRVLQEKEFERVGGKETLKADVRILAATNRDLKELVAKGLFREDLYYRLNVVPIHLPPLRERKEDIPLLVRHFLKKLNVSFDKRFTGISAEALDSLMRYDWPGNVRELRNTLEKAMLLDEEPVITNAYLPEEVRNAAESGVVPPHGADTSSLEDAEKAHILRVLTECRWNQSRAASRLGIHRNTLRNKIEKLGLDRPTTQTD